YKDDLAQSHFNLGNLFRINLNRLPNAVHHYELAAQIWTELNQKHPAVIRYADYRARALHFQAVSYVATKQPEKAAETIRQEIHVAEKLPNASDDPQIRANIADLHLGLAACYREIGQFQLALAEVRVAFDIQGKLVKDRPLVPAFQFQLAGVRNK